MRIFNSHHSFVHYVIRPGCRWINSICQNIWQSHLNAVKTRLKHWIYRWKTMFFLHFHFIDGVDIGLNCWRLHHDAGIVFLECLPPPFLHIVLIPIAYHYSCCSLLLHIPIRVLFFLSFGLKYEFALTRICDIMELNMGTFIQWVNECWSLWANVRA